MRVRSNVPETPTVQACKEDWSLENYLFSIGDRVRVQEKGSYPEYPYVGSGYIGVIKEISSRSLTIESDTAWPVTISFGDIFLMRHAEKDETFNNVPYYDEAEKAFWEDYWLTKDGVRKKTPEDKEMLRKFNEKYQ